MLKTCARGGLILIALSVAPPVHAEFARIETKAEFVSSVSGRELAGPGNVTINADGTFEGVTKRRRLTGAWNWQQGFFCRNYIIRGVASGTDCQTVAIDGDLVEFRGHQGQAEPMIYRKP